MPSGGRSVPSDAVRSGLSAYKDGKKYQVDLQNHLRHQMLPTPTVNDSKNSTLPPSQIERDGLAVAMLRDPSIPTGEATYLNPSFVEEMMGYPVGWTVSKH
jgi:hypothetical protein